MNIVIHKCDKIKIKKGISKAIAELIASIDKMTFEYNVIPCRKKEKEGNAP